MRQWASSNTWSMVWRSMTSRMRSWLVKPASMRRWPSGLSLRCSRESAESSISASASCCSLMQPALTRRAPSFSSVMGSEMPSTRPFTR